MNTDPQNPNRVIESNQAFFDELKRVNADYSKTTLFIGSNRQSRMTDIGNYYAGDGYTTYTKGSAFNAIKKIRDYLNDESDSVVFDPLLLADVYGDLEAGVAFESVFSPIVDEMSQANWVFDETKLSLVYAQMHKLAAENPNEAIEFAFYDDRVDILGSLETYFKQNPRSIPSNVTLSLNHYDGAKAEVLFNLKGEGTIDEDYRKTVLKMEEETRQIQRGYRFTEKYHFSSVINDEIIDKIRKTHISNEELELRNFETVLRDAQLNFKSKIKSFKQQAIEPFEALKGNDTQKNTVLCSFIQEIKEATTDLSNKQTPTHADLAVFKRACTKSIDKADVTLRYHKNWAPLVQNLLACLTIIGLIPACYSLYKRHTEGRYAFFDNTKSNEGVVSAKAQTKDFEPLARQYPL
jgi:hypothetical protein